MVPFSLKELTLLSALMSGVNVGALRDFTDDELNDLKGKLKQAAFRQAAREHQNERSPA